jgi:radical SAM protein
MQSTLVNDRDAHPEADFAASPYIVFFEVTQACDLACIHCRASARPCRDPNELSTEYAMRLFDELASFPRRPIVVLTGGDPAKRPDLVKLVEHGVSRGLEMALTPSATELVTRERLRSLAQAGLSRLAVSLDGPDATTHDRFRGTRGSFDRTLRIMADACALELPLQVNTTVTRSNWRSIDDLAELLTEQAIALWAVFFLVPVGRAGRDDCLNAEECEAVFASLWNQSQRRPFPIKSTEAPHYRRYVLQQRKQLRVQGFDAPPSSVRRLMNLNDGRGTLFIGHTGCIQPTGFLPLECGRFPQDSVVDVYQNSPVFRALRDADALGGKCGHCEYRRICGGSRARAYALTGDYLAEEPLCAYIPSVDAPADTEGTNR